MNYISAKEAAEKWGITPRRVAYLAKGGKIEGATLLGKSWLIPVHAKKPEDGRSQQKTDSFRFPLLTFYDYTENDPRLTEEERILWKGQTLSTQGHFEESTNILRRLLTSSSSTIQIGAAYYLLQNAIFLSDMTNVDTCLRFFTEKSIPASSPQELLLIRYDVETYIKGNKALMENYSVDSSYPYQSDALPYIAVLDAYRAILFTSSRKKETTYTLELVAMAYEKVGYGTTSARIYLYLALHYLFRGSETKAIQCAKEGVRLAFQNESYLALITTNRVTPEFFARMMEDRTEEEKNFVCTLTKHFTEGMQALLAHQKRKSFDFELTDREYELLLCMLRGMTNKEIAARMKLSENSISKYYVQLYAKTGVANKQELFMLYRDNLYEFLEKED